MRERYVSAPDGMKWVVGRKFLLGPPRYRGFRFGLGGGDRFFEPAARPATGDAAAEEPGAERPRVVRDRPGPDHTVRREPPARYRDVDSHWHRPRRRSTPIIIPTGRSSGGWGGGWGGSGGSVGGGDRGSSGGGNRGGIGGGNRGGSGGGNRGGGGGGAAGGAGALLAGAGGAGAMLVKVLWWVLIAAAIGAALFLAIFVVIPGILLGLQFLLIGVLIAWRAMTGRPWVVEARENRAAPLIHAWEVTGWAESGRVRDEVAEALRRGEEPRPAGAVPVEISGS